MASLTITLFEHQSRAYSEIGLSERVLAELERLNALAGQEILRLGRKELRANSLVGVIRAGDVTIEILPKIDWTPSGSLQPTGHGSSPEDPVPGQRKKRSAPASSEGAAADTATRNLLTMLAYAYNLPIHELENASLGIQTTSWIELLTRLFANGLYRE